MQTQTLTQPAQAVHKPKVHVTCPNCRQPQAVSANASTVRCGDCKLIAPRSAFVADQSLPSAWTISGNVD
jgi:LSD1 subclass zinc finger protein